MSETVTNIAERVAKTYLRVRGDETDLLANGAPVNFISQTIDKNPYAERRADLLAKILAHMCCAFLTELGRPADD